MELIYLELNYRVWIRNIVSSIGLVHGSSNICLKEEKPFIHLHVVLGNNNGRVFIGYLVKGEIFVTKIVILLETAGENPHIRRSYRNLWRWKEIR